MEPQTISVILTVLASSPEEAKRMVHDRLERWLAEQSFEPPFPEGTLLSYRLSAFEWTKVRGGQDV